MWWLALRQPVRVLRGAFFGTAWMTGLAARPYLVSRAVDDGLRKGDQKALLWWVGAIVVSGFVLAWMGIMRHRTMTMIREDATGRSAALVLNSVSHGGSALARRLAAGEVSTVSGMDISTTSLTLTILGPGIGAIVSYGVVAAMLWAISPMLALMVLLGVPAVALIIGPLLRRLERAESTYRHQHGALTARAGDIVAGLRVLAGVGGRRLFAESYVSRSQGLLLKGYGVGAVTSWIFALMVVIPGMFLAAVVWLAARMAAAGDITIGQMVAVYGFAAVLTAPVWFLIEGGYMVIRGRVAARRLIAVLNLVPDSARESATAAAPEGLAPLHDPDTGLTVHCGQFLGLAAADPGEAIALADRLGRFCETRVTWGEVPLAEIPLSHIRKRILVADHDSYIFAGELRKLLCLREGLSDKEIRAALHAASAEDVVDALPDGLGTRIGTRARTLSGGQRQRVRLARALLAEPEILILIDPTSAVDAHTEARVAQRLKEFRAGRTTVVVTTSPLLLVSTDAVSHLRDGRVVSHGPHADLLQRDPLYRSLVSRDADIDDSLEEALSR